MSDVFLADTVDIRCDNSLVVQHLRFCGVQCIARSVSHRHAQVAQLTRCFSAVAELLVCKWLTFADVISVIIIILVVSLTTIADTFLLYFPLTYALYIVGKL